MSERLVLHEYARSGNCYKIRLTAAHVGAALERREYDIMKGETRTPEFLSEVNANGRIPTLQVGERFLPESNAACWYLASGSALIPENRFDQADVLGTALGSNPTLAIERYRLRELDAALDASRSAQRPTVALSAGSRPPPKTQAPAACNSLLTSST